MELSKCSLRLFATLIAFSVVLHEVRCASGVADSYPVVVEDGEDNFLILNNEEVSSAEILKHISGASKEEVEEIVDTNPQVQDMILGRIKKIVDKRKTKKVDAAKKLGKDSAKKQAQKVKVVAIKPVEKLIVVHDGALTDEDDGDGDDDDYVDDKKIAAWRKKLEGKTAKLFKIGSKVKSKLMKFAKKNDKKKPNSPWRPHFHYHVTTS